MAGCCNNMRRGLAYNTQLGGMVGKRIRSNILLIIIISLVLSVSGQLLLKRGIITLGEIHLDSVQAVFLLLRAFAIPAVQIGILCYVASIIFWIVVLSRVELSFAYPMGSISYIIVAFFSRIFFHEHISPCRWAGIFIICAGVFLVSITGPENNPQA